MRLYVLVEGPSEAILLEQWLPRLLPAHTFKIIQHRGKGKIPKDPTKPPIDKHEGLLDQLPAKLRAFGRTLDSDTDRVVVLVDLDDDDCAALKKKLVSLLDHCDPKPYVLFRIAIEETESFYLGDSKGIKSAFPSAKTNKFKSYTQDSICGAWEFFKTVIGTDADDKVEWARLMGEHLTTDWSSSKANKSPSFCQFCKGLLRHAGEPIE